MRWLLNRYEAFVVSRRPNGEHPATLSGGGHAYYGFITIGLTLDYEWRQIQPIIVNGCGFGRLAPVGNPRQRRHAPSGCEPWDHP